MQTVKDLDDLVRLVSAGEVVAFETDTVPALAAKAFIETARLKIAHLKGRSASQKMQVLVDGDILSQIILPSITPPAKSIFQKLADAFWPGALTIVAPSHLDGATLGVRYPNHAGVLEILKHTGALWATSANLSGGIPARGLNQVQAIFGDSVHYYLSPEDDIQTEMKPNQIASTVVQIAPPGLGADIGVSSAEQVKILRHGSISESQILSAL
ncbi:MAG: Sua5/YciO/YrdC/YwlC family protein [Candidatus Ancillula sp.]|jgi:L-threonylcarbamoyladenylate synthase|nr:Sua5/YciO/YrdC/YwlC family protein [Candidatus Ancillula sp.]